MIRWLRSLVYHAFGDAPDTAWKSKGLKFTTPRTYDYELAKEGARRARRRSATGRMLPKPSPHKPAEIVALRRAK